MSPDSAEKFLESIGIIVSRHLGDGNIMCHCPFHRDDKPSFSFHGDKEVFNCFSCGESGYYLKLLDLIDDEEYIPHIEIDIERGPLAAQFHSLQDLAREVFVDTNDAIRLSSASPDEKDWCYDRLDQVFASMPVLAGAGFQELARYEKQIHGESIAIIRFIRAVESDDKAKVNEALASPYYAKHWKIYSPGEGDGIRGDARKSRGAGA